MNFVVRNLSEEQIALLASKGVIVDFFEEPFFLLRNSNDTARLAEALNTDIIFTKDTMFTGISELVLGCKEEEAELEVSIGNWDGMNSRGFVKAVKKILLPIIKTNITLSVPHGSRVLPLDSDSFNIFIWSGPGIIRNNIHCPPKIWGIEVEITDSYSDWSGLGEPINDGEYTVATLLDNNLYINHDICHSGNNSEIKIFKEILKRTCALINKDYDSTNVKEKFIEKCKTNIEIRIQAEESNRTILNNEFNNIKENLIQTSRDLEVSELNLINLKEVSKRQEINIEKEFKRITQIKEIKIIYTHLGSLIFKTQNLSCKDPKSGKIFDLGEFLIHVNSNGKITIKNETRVVDCALGKMFSPVVGINGRIKIDKIQKYIPDLIALYKYSDMLKIIINCLTVYDKTYDMYWKELSKWPELKAEEVPIKKVGE